LSLTSGSAADWDARYRQAGSVWSSAPNEFLARELAELATTSMIDLAGGEGRHALWFAARGVRSENVEFSKAALEKFEARSKELGLYELTVSTLADARDAKFQLSPDLVVVCYLQLTWPDLSRALSNALDQMQGGEIFGVWHSSRNLTDGYGGPQNPNVLPTVEDLTDWVSDNALSGNVWEEERLISVADGEYRAIDVLLRAKL